MNETTLTKMRQMKLFGINGAFKSAIETSRTDNYTLYGFAAHLTGVIQPIDKTEVAGFSLIGKGNGTSY